MTALEHVSSLELVPSAWQLAERIARTEFVPASLRGKPEAVLACILTGHELGIGPMQALAKIHVIDGRPAMSAELMRAVIAANGHQLWVIESTNTRATIGCQRNNSTREQTFTWTLDDANIANLKGRDNWRKYPRAMLLARATAEAARAVFPDVLAGISYTVEELQDDAPTGADQLADITLLAPPIPSKKARAQKAATRKAAPVVDVVAPALEAPPLPPLPGEDEPYEPVHEEHEARPLAGPAAIAVALHDKGIHERDDKLVVVSHLVGTDVGSTNDLTAKEIGRVLRVINAKTADELADIVRRFREAQ